MILYNDRDGLIMFTLFGEDSPTGRVPLGSLALIPGFNELPDSLYAKYAGQIEADENIYLNAEKRKFESLPVPHILDGWYHEPYTKDSVKMLWGDNEIPETVGLADVPVCVKMQSLTGGIIRLHGLLIVSALDGSCQLGIGGQKVLTGFRDNGSTLAWTLNKKSTANQFIHLCKKYPFQIR